MSRRTPETTTETPPAEQVVTEATAQEPRPQGRTTTRGMLPELKAVDSIYKTLAELEPAEARWVLDFINLKFPKAP